MKLNNSHKASAITFLLFGTLVLSVYNLTVYKSTFETSDFEVNVEIIKDELQEVAELNITDNSKQTNQAFNETKSYKHYADAYKPIAPPEDYDYSKYNSRNDPKVKSDDPPQKEKVTPDLEQDESSNFEDINKLIKKHTSSSPSRASANLNSTVRYSLEGRTDLFLPIPVYLCEANGKIVVNIVVNNYGEVIKARVDKITSTSNNVCLKESAVEYAKKARFNSVNSISQKGTITFNFKGKSN